MIRRLMQEWAGRREDRRREQRIHALGKLLLAALEQDLRVAAQLLWRDLRDEINARSPRQQALMERRRGLG